MFYRHDDIKVELDNPSPKLDNLLEEIVEKLSAEGKNCTIVSRGKVPMISIDGNNYWVELQHRYDAGEKQTVVLKLD